MQKIMKELHKQNMANNEKYAFYHEKHNQFCQEFDDLSENNGTIKDYQKLCLEILDAFSDLYFMDKE